MNRCAASFVLAGCLFPLTVTADFVCMQSTQRAACASCAIAHHGEHVLEMLGKLSFVPCGSRRQKLWMLV